MAFRILQFLKTKLTFTACFPLRGYEIKKTEKSHERKNYTLTEKELFDLIEYEKYSSFCAAIIKAVQEYNADSEMTSVLFKAFMKAIALSIELSPKTEEISDTFYKERMNEETNE